MRFKLILSFLLTSALPHGATPTNEYFGRSAWLTYPHGQFEELVLNRLSDERGDEWSVELDDVWVELLIQETTGDLLDEACDPLNALYKMYPSDRQDIGRQWRSGHLPHYCQTLQDEYVDEMY